MLHLFKVWKEKEKNRPARTQRVIKAFAPGKGIFIIQGETVAASQEEGRFIFIFPFFKKDFFGCGPVLKSSLNLLQHCFRFMFQFFSMWDLSSTTRDRTPTPALEGELLTTGLPGKSLNFIFNIDIICFWSMCPFLQQLKQMYSVCLIGHRLFWLA